MPAWAPAVPAQRRGLPRSGCERLLWSGYRGRWGLQPRDDRRLHGQPGYLRRCVLSKSLLGAGLVGQVLYLEAEEASIRSTGIGCYFDDPVHEVFGIFSRDRQSFYHFTVGGPVEDKRLTTLPAYKLENEP